MKTVKKIFLTNEALVWVSNGRCFSKLA